MGRGGGRPRPLPGTARRRGAGLPRPVVHAPRWRARGPAGRPWRRSRRRCVGGRVVLSSCHGVMHTVGRTYALARGAVALGPPGRCSPRSRPRVQRRLRPRPRHGRGPSLDVREPRKAGEGAPTRATVPALQLRPRPSATRSCVSTATARAALGLCRALGEPAPDCAQGAYHDYWFAVVGADDAELPAWRCAIRAFCARSAGGVVRPCGNRAFVDDRPAGIVVDSRSTSRCSAATSPACNGRDASPQWSVIGPPDRRCNSALRGARARGGCGAASAARRCRTCSASRRQRSSTDRPCELFTGATRAACYRWLGKTIAVVTDGDFADSGCPQARGVGSRAAVP